LLDGKTLSEEDYVVKVEPHNNGPLFVELHFYCRATKKEDLDNFAAKKNIKHLGVPDLKGHGSFIHRKKKLRFIVMPRYGTDLQTKIDESKSCLSLESTSHLATQIIDSLEYLHSQGYVHKDLKANNMIFRRDQKGMNDKLFLVDFGLASRYLHLGIHRPFEPDQRSAHEGTLEYVSRDGHLGCVSRRGDMECLLYVIIEWLGGHLPWDTDDDER
jgi:vaccinia related kinase